MTRGEAKYFWPIIKAYSEGKDIQFFLSTEGWIDITNDFLFDDNHQYYRIKQEPKYRPFRDKDECWSEMQKHQPLGWVKSKKTNRLYNISSIYEDGGIIKITTDDFIVPAYELFDNFVFTDDTPFGIECND